MKTYPAYKGLDLPALAKEVGEFWEANRIFEKSVSEREGAAPYVFYEGPPSANGIPGIHHVMSRALKDLFCRYKTLQGYSVERRAGWDTHGLPIELSVEKKLGITKEDIGKKISVEEYNAECRREVMKYTDLWERVTKEMGYWVDMQHPYITYENTYVESVWHLLKRLYDKGLLYKGYTIQPYSPAAGTGLSSHELNQPGTYKQVKDTTVVAMFKLLPNEKSDWLTKDAPGELFFLAWTTTPWTLPSNTALAVGKNITYVKVATFNQYTYQPITVILAKALIGKHFAEKNAGLALEDYKEGDKAIPFKVLGEFPGEKLEGLRYEQLLPYAQPTEGDAFRVVLGDFVTTEDGTGIVHIAPSFGGDDFRVAKQNGIGSLTLVDRAGRFTEEVTDFPGAYVKEAYEDPDKLPEDYKSVDVRIVIMLKERNRAFKVEKYEHSYPHCWRTDKPVLYYPLDSWFIRTTAKKDRMIELNKTINWKPESTGTGRFGNWLENLQDWNLSRSRFWGIPLPPWRMDDNLEEKCIGSAEDLKKEIEKSVRAGFMQKNPLGDFQPGDFSKENYNTFDLHKPYVDEIILVSGSGKPMRRESDLIDVWFDSGAMPYAQLHYPFENKELIESGKAFPADFIAEGVDQTRGWFFTLHAIATMIFDSVAYKNVVSNGLVLDKDGNKMSKRLGNAVDPFITLDKYGPDATRWYMITNAQPWDNLKFDFSGIEEVQRKFFGTLHNTYGFFSLYANIDGFAYAEPEVAMEDRPELDRWILSKLNSLIAEVTAHYDDYEPTKAGRAMEEFLDEHLSNWYVRLSRRRFWKGEYGQDKISAYQTLYACLEALAIMSAPIAPFFAERLYRDLNGVSGKREVESVHLAHFPQSDAGKIDKALEARMELAQSFSSMVLSLRKKSKLRVRQPLQKIMIPILDESMRTHLEGVKDLILSEVNVKELEYLAEDSDVIVKKMKPDFKKLGPKYGPKMKLVQNAIGTLGPKDIAILEKEGQLLLPIPGEELYLTLNEVEILSEDIEGWLVASSGRLTVALDITLTEDLKDEGLARELVNRLQNIRKDSGLEVTDRIRVQLEKGSEIARAAERFEKYICSEILADSLELRDDLNGSSENVQIDELTAKVSVQKAN